jgi:hypothetical protein
MYQERKIEMYNYSHILSKKQKYPPSQAVLAQAFNPSTWEAEASWFLISRPAWSTEWVPGQPGLHRETLSWGGGAPNNNKTQKLQSFLYSNNYRHIHCSTQKE